MGNAGQGTVTDCSERVPETPIPLTSHIRKEMPLVLANVRKAGMKEQSGGGQFTSYVRSAPSTVFWTVTDNLVTYITSLFFMYVSVIHHLIHDNGKYTSYSQEYENETLFVDTNTKYSDIPLRLPGIMFRFKGAIPRDVLQDIIEMGCQEMKLPGSNKSTWSLERPSVQQAAYLGELSNLDTFIPPTNYVLAQSILHLMRIAVSVHDVSATLLTIRNSVSQTPFEMHSARIEMSSTFRNITVRGVPLDIDGAMDVEEGQVAEKNITGDGVLDTPFHKKTSHVFDYTGGNRRMYIEPFVVNGPALELPEYAMTVPFAHTFAAPDVCALTLFLRRYGYAFFESEDVQNESL